MKRAAMLLSVVMLAACNAKPEEKKSAGPPATLITTTTAQTAPFEVLEETVGTLESLQDPKIGAEVAGRVEKVLVTAGVRVKRGDLLAVLDATDAKIQSEADSADMARLSALLAQQERLVERQAELVKKGFISSNAAEDAIAQRNALREQHAASRARLEASRRQQSKARVLAPIDGVIDTQLVSPGDYVKVGDGLFQLVSNRNLRAHLPFPESAQGRLKPGQRVRLSSPLDPASVIEASISEIRPVVTEGARSLGVLVNLPQESSLRAGGSVNAAVLIAQKADALTVPEQSVVLRPAGKVVYVIDANRARQQIVEVGSKRAGRVEILSGLTSGQTIALDGAGFLAEGAAVQVKAPEKAGR
ncbi:MAG: hypothetical protein RIR70_1209 [Pseudomonadota bacterium]|jgi:RND family efflux transporter MFP subunit